MAVRSYRPVVDEVERRIFRIDRWRLPTPYGVPVRTVGYAVAVLVAVLAIRGLPLLGQLVDSVPGSVRYLVLPAIGGWALNSARLDGRPPHHVALAALRHGLGPRTLAGLRRAPAVGSCLSPVEVDLAASGDEDGYRHGRVRGPATIVLRYPAELAFERVPRRARADADARLTGARRIRVRALRGAPLARGREIEVPDGAEVVFER
jgi:hypothetical protein